MALKRKRSSDESPLSISSYTASTPDAQSPTPLPDQYDGAMELDMPRSFDLWARRKGGMEGSSLGCRTRKRVRDNRPDERVIHGKPLMYYGRIGSVLIQFQKTPSTNSSLPNARTPTLNPSSPSPTPLHHPTLPNQSRSLHCTRFGTCPRWLFNLPPYTSQHPTKSRHRWGLRRGARTAMRRCGKRPGAWMLMLIWMVEWERAACSRV
jgi:hypothetical protein